jgi:hypothetical protein
MRYHILKRNLFFLLLIALPFHAAQAGQSKINILTSTTATQLKQMVLLDARNLKACLTSSVAGAKCLPANTFHSKKGDLASFYDIGWAFGTANLKETADVLVFADEPQDRYALSGLLFLAGHHKVSYWSGKISELQKLLGSAAGWSRGILRTNIYRGIMRDNYIALPNEIEAFQNNGWQIALTSKLNPGLKLKNKKLLIAGISPITNIATFAQLLAEGHYQLLLSLDKKS